jgi:hypothetical protein
MKSCGGIVLFQSQVALRRIGRGTHSSLPSAFPCDKNSTEFVSKPPTPDQPRSPESPTFDDGRAFDLCFEEIEVIQRGDFSAYGRLQIG